MENRLYFGNIPFDKTEDDVQKLFQECGQITELKIIRRDHVSQGYGFITFSTKEAVDAALQKNGQEVGGRSMKVNYAAKRDPTVAGAPADTNRLFVKGLLPETTEENIKEAFAAHGVVTAVKFIKDHNTGESRGFAFVDFETQQQAQAALAMHDSKALGPTPLVVKVARDKKQQMMGFNRMGGYSPYQYGHYPQQIPGYGPQYGNQGGSWGGRGNFQYGSFPQAFGYNQGFGQQSQQW